MSADDPGPNGREWDRAARAARAGRPADRQPHGGVRQRELNQLAGELAAAKAGDGRSVLLTGSPGMGKSWALAAVCRTARQMGIEVWSATGSLSEQMVPFGLLRALVGPAVHRDGGRLLAGRASLADRVLRLPVDHDEPAVPVGGGSAREPSSGEVTPLDLVVLDALHWLVVNAAERRPLLLAVDDLHWTDASSIRFLGYLSRRLGGLPLLLLVAGRRRELDLVALGSAFGPGGTTEVRLPPLLPEETSAVLAELFHRPPDPDFSTSCHELARGNPLVLVELARSALAARLTPTSAGLGGLEVAGTEAIGRTVALRMAEVGPPALRLAEAGAVLGDRSPLAWAAELAGLDGSDTALAVDRLQKTEILAAVGSPLEEPGPAGPQIVFVHPLVAASLRDGMDPLTLSRWHERAAELLGARGVPAPAVAGHLLAVAPAGSPDRVTVLRRAARAALDGGDVRRAATFAHRALAEARELGPVAAADRAELLSLAARAEERFDVMAAATHYEEAAELTHQPADRARRLLQAAALYPSDRPEEAIRLGDAAVATLGDADTETDTELYRTTVAVVSTTRCLAAPSDPDPRFASIGLPAGAKESWDDAPPSTRMLAAVGAFRTVWDGSSTAAEARALAEPVFQGNWTGTLNVTGGPLVLAVLVLVAADSPVAPRAVDQWVALGRSLGSLAHTGGALWLRAHLGLVKGDLDDAAADAGDGSEAFAGAGVGGAAQAAIAAVWTGALLERGQIHQAGQVLADAQVTAGDPGSVGRCWLALCRARCRAAAGDVRAALEETLHVGDRYVTLGGRNPALLPWRSQAATLVAGSELAADPGLLAMAVDLAGGEVQAATRWGAPTALSLALSAAAGVDPDPDRAVALAERAVGVATGPPDPGVALPGPLVIARARAALGRAHLRAGSAEEAREQLRTALDLADHCGSTELATQVRADLVRAGGRPRRNRLTGPEALTPNERRTAELVAAGATNREVAETLFLTVRAVEAQLTSIYRKLGIRSRLELAEIVPPAEYRHEGG